MAPFNISWNPRGGNEHAAEWIFLGEIKGNPCIPCHRFLMAGNGEWLDIHCAVSGNQRRNSAGNFWKRKERERRDIKEELYVM